MDQANHTQNEPSHAESKQLKLVPTDTIQEPVAELHPGPVSFSYAGFSSLDFVGPVLSSLSLK